MRSSLQRAIIESRVKSVDARTGGVAMRDVWMAAAGFVLGWLMSRTWQDPGCRIGLVVFLVVTAAMILAFALAVVGHRRPTEPSPDDDGDDSDTRMRPS
jgi:hypothetical protein